MHSWMTGLGLPKVEIVQSEPAVLTYATLAVLSFCVGEAVFFLRSKSLDQNPN